MDPRAALDEQISRYRRMTGEQRLGIALALHELACDVSREGIRALHPNADDAEVERQLRSRIVLAYRTHAVASDDVTPARVDPQGRS